MGTFAGSFTFDVENPPESADAGDTVVSETSFGQASAAGVDADYSREDHTHGTPAVPAHDDLSSVTSDQHHDESHSHDGVDGSGTVAHSATTGRTTDDHHPQAHTHPAEGAVVVTHTSTTGQTTDDHHDEDHAARHAENGADELDAASLGSGASTDGQVLTSDGVGGAAWEEPPLPTLSALCLDGSGDYAETPDDASLDITGDITLAGVVALDDWTPGAVQPIVAKWDASPSDQRSYQLVVDTDGTLVLAWTTAGTLASLLSAASTVAPAVSDGASLLVGATLDVDDGSSQHVVKFYTMAFSPSTYAADLAAFPTGWTQLGTTITVAGTTSIFSGSAPLHVGALVGISSFEGNIVSVIVKNGYDGAGSVVADPDFGNSAPTDTTVVDSTGKTYTLQGDAEFCSPVGDHASRHAENGADELDVASLGSGASAAGTVATSNGAGGVDWETPGGGISYLFRDFGNDSVSNTTTETDIFSHSLSVAEMDDQGIELELLGVYTNTTGTARTCLFNVYLGATQIVVAVAATNPGLGADRPVRLRLRLRFTASGATGLKATVLEGNMGPAGSTQASYNNSGTDQTHGILAVTTTAVDTTADRTLRVTVTHAAANASISYTQAAAILRGGAI